MATHVGTFVKTFLEGTCVYCWIAKLFSPMVMFAISQTRSGKIILPYIPKCYWPPLGNSWFGFGHWLIWPRVPFRHYNLFVFAICYGALSSCYKKSLLTKQCLSSLIIVLDFMVYHKSLCFIDTLPCWQIWQSFTRKLNTKLIMSAARHPRIDGLIERVV